MYYYIHISLPEELQNRVEAIRFKYKYSAKSKPHVTLVPPLKLLDGHTDTDLMKVIEIVAKKTNPFPVTQIGVGYFNNKEIIHVIIERTNELLLLHRELLEAISGILETSEGEFAELPQPHITIISLPPENGHEAWRAIKNEFLSGQFTCNSIVLLKRGPKDKQWKVARLFKLGK